MAGKGLASGWMHVCVDGLPELVVCSGCCLSDQGLDLGECHLDGVEVGRVWRQEFEGSERRPVDGFPRKTNQAPMSFKIAAGCGGWRGCPVHHPTLCRVGANWVSTERSKNSRFIHCPAVHPWMHERGSIEHPRRVQPAMTQSRDEGLGLPPLTVCKQTVAGQRMAKRGVIHQTRPAWCPSGGLGHVGLPGPSPGVSIPRIDPFSRFDVDQCQLVSMLRMKGWRRPIHIRRANAASGRFCSMARKSFCVCQAETAQMPPIRDAVGLDALDLTKFDNQFIKLQVALFLDPAPDPV